MQAEQCYAVLFNLPNESVVYDVLSHVQQAYRPIHAYVSIAMCVLGTIANFCNIVVLTRRTMRTPVNMILTAMACCDTVVLFSNLIYTTHYSFVAFKDCHPRHWSYGWALFLISHAHLSLVGHSASVWLSVTLAAIRYQTLRVRGSSNGRTVGLKHSYVAIAAVVGFVAFMNAPNFLTYKIVEMSLNDTCPTTPKAFEYSPAYLPDIADLALARDCFVFRMAFWISGTVFKVIPCCLLSVLVGLLLKILKEVKENRQRLFRPSRNSSVPQAKASENGELVKLARAGSQRGRREAGKADRTTQMLLAIVFVLLFTELPQGVMAVLSGMFSTEFRVNIYNNVGDFLDLLSLCGACTSFIIYCTMSGQFRNEFRRVFLPDSLSCNKRYSMRRLSSEAYTKMSLFPPSRTDAMSNSYASPDERSIALTVVGSTQQTTNQLKPEAPEIRRTNTPVSPLTNGKALKATKESPAPSHGSTESASSSSSSSSSSSNSANSKPPADSEGSSPVEVPHADSEAALLLNGHPVSFL